MTPEQEQLVGATGAAVIENIRRIRTDQRFPYAALSRELAAVGRPIPVLGLRRLERGQRRVDVDDLMAFALVLKVAPIELLVSGDHAAAMRAWICGQLTMPPEGAPRNRVVIELRGTSGLSVADVIRKYVRTTGGGSDQ